MSPSEPDSPPVNLTVVDTSPSTTTLAWSAPEKANGGIQYYEVLYENESFSALINTSTNRVILMNLKPFSYYNVSVRAYTRYGHGNQTSETLYLLSGEDGVYDGCTHPQKYTFMKIFINITNCLDFSRGAFVVLSLQSQVVLRMVSTMSRSVPVRWMWPGSLLCCLTESLPTTAWNFGIPVTTWTSPPWPTTSTSHIWGSMRTTVLWCRHTRVSDRATTAASRLTSPHWRMVRGMGGRKRKGGGGVVFSFSRLCDYIMTSWGVWRASD